MNYTQAIDQVRDVVVKMRYLESIDNIIYCDKWHVCPKDGFSYEADVNAYLAEIRHDQLVNDHVARKRLMFKERLRRRLIRQNRFIRFWSTDLVRTLLWKKLTLSLKSSKKQFGTFWQRQKKAGRKLTLLF